MTLPPEAKAALQVAQVRLILAFELSRLSASAELFMSPCCNEVVQPAIVSLRRPFLADKAKMASGVLQGKQGFGAIGSSDDRRCGNNRIISGGEYQSRQPDITHHMLG